ncbi:SurA N-terminal domain-containing protein [Radiobacillus sp. PE A8.2]|uniref:SurA N-terminal domain-containing protein n=1 Tax=Radiobacillus sp. PE A8.2 TaxID=3380349 RepID=UPI0038906BA2
MKQKLLLIVAAVSLSLLLAACSGQEESADDNTQNTDDTSSDVTEVEKVAEDKVVATVNGEEITGSKYNDMYSQTLMMFQQYGQDVSDASQLQEQTLSRLIEQELLLQEAAEVGIEAPSSEIDDRLAQIKSQFESDEQYQQQLTELELTEQSLQNQLAYEIKLNKYMEQELPAVEVTDQEIQDYYDQLVNQQGDQAPALEEVESQIRDALMQQKQQGKLAAEIEILREESEIETLI